jgi:hypothetical protein
MSDKTRIQENIDALKSPFEIAEMLADRFIKEYGTFTCAQIHRRMLGRIFYLPDKDEMEKFKGLGGLKLAADVVGKGVGWVIEVLIDNGIIEV